MSPRPTLPLALLLAASLAAPPASPAAPPSDRPVFSVEVEQGAVDVSVFDEEGRPVRGLGPADFELKVDGKAVPVVSAELIEQETEVVVEEAAPAPRRWSSNARASAGRLILLVIDEGNIPLGQGKREIEAARRLVDRLDEADRIGLLTLPGSGPRVEFTADHQAVREALDRIVGRGRLGGKSVSLLEALAFVTGEDSERWIAAVNRECGSETALACAEMLKIEADQLAYAWRHQSTRSLGVLKATFQALARIEGRKEMVLVSGGLGLPNAGPRGLSDDFYWVPEAAAASRVALHTVKVQPSSAVSSGSSLSHSALWEDANTVASWLADFTSRANGTVHSGTPEEAFTRIAREVSGYYLLGFEPTEKQRNGKSHKVSVRVARKGVTVRAHSRTTIARPASGREAAKDVAALLEAPRVATSLPVRAATWSLGDPASDRVRILVGAEIGRGSTPEGLTVGYVLLDASSRVVKSSIQSAERAAGTGPQSYSTTLSVPPGTYTLRLGARDGRGRLGSVEHRVQASLTRAGSLGVGDLLIGPLPEPGQAFRPQLEPESGARELLAHLELVSADAGTLAGVAVDVETARDEEGPSLSAVPALLADAKEPGRRVAQVRLDTSALEPGTYVVRARVSVAGREAAVVTAPLRVVARTASR